MAGIYRIIPDAALAAGKRANPFLMRALRDNDESLDHHRQAFETALSESAGHAHAAVTVETSFTFIDLIRVVAGVNDQVPFRFASTSPAYSVASYSPTLTPGEYDLVELAALVQLAMRSAVDSGSPGSVPISVSCDMDLGSKTRGKFMIQHTGGSGAGNELSLLFRSGTGAAAGVGPSMAYPRRDQRKAFGYRGAGGFAHGYVQERVTLTGGGLLGASAWVPGAFTAAKIADNTIESRCFQNGSVSGGKIAANAISAAKMGDPATSTPATFGLGLSHTFQLDVGVTGSGRIPTVHAFSVDGSVAISEYDLQVFDPVFVSGSTWDVDVINAGAIASINVAAY